MDGVLVDSESKYPIAIQKMLKRIGANLSLEQRIKFIGTSSRTNAQLIKGWCPHIDMTEDELSDLYAKTIFDTLTGIDSLVDGLEEWFARLKSEGVKLAVASSSSEVAVGWAAENLGLGAVMDVIVSGNDVKVAKPEPDIFLEAARRLGVPAERCLVIEDSQNGLLAASAAGMDCVEFYGAPGLGNMAKGGRYHIEKYDDANYDLLFGKL